jgi:hypothetical protein
LFCAVDDFCKALVPFRQQLLLASGARQCKGPGNSA